MINDKNDKNHEIETTAHSTCILPLFAVYLVMHACLLLSSYYLLV